MVTLIETMVLAMQRRIAAQIPSLVGKHDVFFSHRQGKALCGAADAPLCDLCHPRENFRETRRRNAAFLYFAKAYTFAL
jgi:hypothetical protein